VWQQKCCRRWPTIQHTLAEHRGITANKIRVIEQLAYKNKEFIIVLQETHWTTADKLLISNFSLAGSVLSRKYGTDTFVHERLGWSLVDQSPEQSKTEWLRVYAAEYKIINIYKPRRSRLTHTDIPTFPHPQFVCWWLQIFLYCVTSSFPHAKRETLNMHRSKEKYTNTRKKTRIYTLR